MQYFNWINLANVWFELQFCRGFTIEAYSQIIIVYWNGDKRAREIKLAIY